NSARGDLALQHMSGLVGEAELVANLFEVQMQSSAPVSLTGAGNTEVAALLAQLDVQKGAELFLFDAAGTVMGQMTGQAARPGHDIRRQPPLISDMLTGLWTRFGPWIAPPAPLREETIEDLARRQVEAALNQGSQAFT